VSAPGARPHVRAWIVAAALIALGTLLRLRGLAEGALFIDEAESSLNALSILEHGYPADSYLGLPMFENTLTEPWPGSAEYEFRDTSYSSRGMAIYHGWLPLYAIAGSFALHGIEPDVATDPPRVQHDDEAIRRRIRAARLPGVAFAALFMLAIFLAGRALYGPDAGLAALALVALAPRCIWLAQQARYYSAGLALGTLAALCAWNVHRRGRWRDWLAAASVLVLLFHTSSLGFAIVLLGSVVLAPGALRRAGALARLAAATGIVALGLVPWMAWSGYLEHFRRVPMARELLEFPSDYLAYLHGRELRTAAGTVLLIAFAVLWRTRRRLPARVASEVERTGPAVLFLTSWIVAAFLGFQALVPAASLSMSRLSHQLVAAPVLLVALGLAAAMRLAWPRAANVAAPALAAMLVLATGGERQERNPEEARAVAEVIEHLRALELDTDTRIYALPYQHFCLTFYTGLPVQSVAPVRREFLDAHPGALVIVESAHRAPVPRSEDVQQAARGAGVELGLDDARRWTPELHAMLVRDALASRVQRVLPEPPRGPEWLGRAADALAHLPRIGPGYRDYARDNPALFRGSPPLTAAEFWPEFFYRFVDPDGRSGDRVNYAGRMRAADALVLPSRWVVVHCPPPGEAGGT
jgi:hypothetical protein